jgi:hypothetical protein
MSLGFRIDYGDIFETLQPAIAHFHFSITNVFLFRLR